MEGTFKVKVIVKKDYSSVEPVEVYDVVEILTDDLGRLKFIGKDREVLAAFKWEHIIGYHKIG